MAGSGEYGNEPCQERLRSMEQICMCVPDCQILFYIRSASTHYTCVREAAYTRGDFHRQIYGRVN
jgi:hypothetical protein